MFGAKPADAVSRCSFDEVHHGFWNPHGWAARLALRLGDGDVVAGHPVTGLQPGIVVSPLDLAVRVLVVQDVPFHPWVLVVQVFFGVAAVPLGGLGLSQVLADVEVEVPGRNVAKFLINPCRSNCGCSSKTAEKSEMFLHAAANCFWYRAQPFIDDDDSCFLYLVFFSYSHFLKFYTILLYNKRYFK